MTRRNKSKKNKKGGKGAHGEHGDLDLQRQEEVVQHSAAVLSCATKAADEMVGVCQEHLKTLTIDVPYVRLALEIWTAPPAAAQPLNDLLEELLQLFSKHLEALKDINQRLEQLAVDPGPHTHLEPLEHYRQLVRERLFPKSPRT